MESQHRAFAQDLADTILAASAPPQIVAACSAVDAFLRRRAAGEQSRPFFSIALPALICRLFGFDDAPPPSSSRPTSTAWIDQASADPSLAGRLFSLLAPGGILISSIASVDRHALVRYVFPAERLPEWIRFALHSGRPPSVLSDLCPLFKGRIKEDAAQGPPYQIQLNAFEYYMFWFAYYPVCKSNSESSTSNVVRKSLKVRLENWTSSLPVLSSATRRPGQKPESNLYLQLLYSYLFAFVPKNGLASYQPYRSSLLHYSFSYDNTAFLQAEFLMHAFVNFWMIDNDFSPLPVNLCRSFDLSFPYNSLLVKNPPTPGLGDVLKLLVDYLNCNTNVSGGGNEQMVHGESPGPKNSRDVVRSKRPILFYEDSLCSWNAVIQRPLYRFILRSFLFCPVEASFKNASQIFNLWKSYLEPWKTNAGDFSNFDPAEVKKSENGGKENSNKGNTVKEGNQKDSQYSPSWESYVLSNYLFYSSLVVHFIWFAHKFLHTNAESVIQMVHKVLNTLTESKQLLDLLRKVDTAYHSKPASSSAYSSNDVYKYVPSIGEQLPDWEDGLCKAVDSSFLHEKLNHELRLFSDAEDGARSLVQLFVTRAEQEIRISSGDVSSSIEALDAIVSQVNVLFGDSWRGSKSPATSQADDLRQDELFTPKYPGIGKRSWADVSYKGDWMRRPISDTEVAWLARIMIRFSDWLNESLGLNHVDDSDSTGPTIVELNSDEISNLQGPKEALNMVLAIIGSWLSLFVNAIVRFMREHRIKINLRVLASKKFVMLLVVYAVFFLLKKVLSRALAVIPA